MLTLRKQKQQEEKLPPNLQRKLDQLNLSLKASEETSHYTVTVSSTEKKDYFWLSGGQKEWALLIECDSDPKNLKVPLIALVYIVSADRIILLRHETITLNANSIDNTVLKLTKYHGFLSECMSQYLIKYNVGDMQERDAKDKRHYSELAQVPACTYFYDELISGNLAKKKDGNETTLL